MDYLCQVVLKHMSMFYFSGTGNSKYIAELFCRNMNAACYSIEDDKNFTQLIAAEEVVGICYPIYGSRVPRIMREFIIGHMDSLKGKELIIFCTQMLFSGDGARAFMDILPHGFAKVIYAEHFLMPNNVCNLFLTPLADETRIRKYLTNVNRKMQTVCAEITNGKIKKRGFNLCSRILGLFQGVFLPGLEKIALSKVWIDDDCNKCLLCVSVCPMNNFEHKDGEITTKNNCTMCYRCINKCPQKAIAVFLRGKVKRQYECFYL
jgi:ferredoxin/flavodoxin